MTPTPFGGDWTEQKLEILRRYLDAYTTALKDQRFQLVYVDAFAGYGSYQTGSNYSSEDYGDFQDLHDGSPRIAVGIQDRPFDRLVFIDEDPMRCESLDALRKELSNRNIEVRNEDANDALPRVCQTLGPYDRVVVFLDPFATQVSWSTVTALAETEKIDCWILFPLMAIARMMPTNREPTDASAKQLDRIFWRTRALAGFLQLITTTIPATVRGRTIERTASR